MTRLYRGLGDSFIDKVLATQARGPESDLQRPSKNRRAWQIPGTHWPAIIA